MRRIVSEGASVPLVRPHLRSADADTFRLGKGFSLGEIKEAGLSVHDLKVACLPIDRLRRSSHDVNVNSLRQALGKKASVAGVKKSKPKEGAKKRKSKDKSRKKGK